MKTAITQNMPARSERSHSWMRAVAALGLLLLTLFLLWTSAQWVKNADASRLAVALVAIVAGIFGIGAIFYTSDLLVNQMPLKLQGRLRPFVFVGPAILVLGLFLVYPTLNTIYISFFDARSENFVGLDNYEFAFTNPAMTQAFRNNVLWIVLVTSISTSLGLLIAVLSDRARFEAVVKSFIFLPMAISFVGASVIWRFVYTFVPAGRPQIGLLNAVVVAFGGEPVGWLINQSYNTYALIFILIWLQTGFCMVLISAAIKGVSAELMEAARIDGANEFQLFGRIVIPLIAPTLATIATTILILTLKVFDIVWVMTNGNFGTEVIANRMIKEMFEFRNFGHGSAIAVVLLVVTIPFMIYNVRRFNAEEPLR